MTAEPFDDRRRRRNPLHSLSDLERELVKFNQHAEHTAKTLGDVAKLLDYLTPRVIAQQTLILDANGTATAQFRVPFRSVTVDSQSAKVLTVTNAPLQEAAPGGGPGVAFVRVGGFAVVNFAGYALSVYGGNAGELVTIAAYAQAQTPSVR